MHSHLHIYITSFFASFFFKELGCLGSNLFLIHCISVYDSNGKKIVWVTNGCNSTFMTNCFFMLNNHGFIICTFWLCVSFRQSWKSGLHYRIWIRPLYTPWHMQSSIQSLVQLYSWECQARSGITSYRSELSLFGTVSKNLNLSECIVIWWNDRKLDCSVWYLWIYFTLFVVLFSEICILFYFFIFMCVCVCVCVCVCSRCGIG